MQKASFFQKWRFYARPRAVALVMLSCMALNGGCADPNVGADAVVVLYPQNVRFCYCMPALLVNVFFAFAAKLHFVCIFSVYPVPPTWLHGVLLSSDGVKMQILCLPFAYFC